MPAEDGGGRDFDRQALQATLADLVRAADESVDAVPEPSGDAVEAAAPPAPRPRIPTVRAPGQKVVADAMPDDTTGATRQAAPRPAAAQPPASTPRPTSRATAEDAEPAPVPHPDGVRPPTSGRPRLPFSLGPAPAPQGGPAGTVRPGPGGLGGSGVRAPSFGAGLGLGADDDAVMAPRGISASSGLPGLGGGRISREQGDNLAKLAPTPTEQPTIALRRRKPADGPGAGAGGGDGNGQGPGGGPVGAGGPAPHGGAAGAQAPAPQAPRPAVAVEPWVPSYDDILPARSARSGRSFRIRK
jgi:translation initiation factor IF-2